MGWIPAVLNALACPLLFSGLPNMETAASASTLTADSIEAPMTNNDFLSSSIYHISITMSRDF